MKEPDIDTANEYNDYSSYEEYRNNLLGMEQKKYVVTYYDRRDNDEDLDKGETH